MKEVWAVAGQRFKELGKQAREYEKGNTGAGGSFWVCVCNISGIMVFESNCVIL